MPGKFKSSFRHNYALIGILHRSGQIFGLTSIQGTQKNNKISLLLVLSASVYCWRVNSRNVVCIYFGRHCIQHTAQVMDSRVGAPCPVYRYI